MTKFAVVVNSLGLWGVLTAIEKIYVARKGGYSLIDGFSVLLAYFCCDETHGNGLRGFCRAMSRGPMGAKLAAILGRGRCRARRRYRVFWRASRRASLS